MLNFEAVVLHVAVPTPCFINNVMCFSFFNKITNEKYYISMEEIMKLFPQDNQDI